MYHNKVFYLRNIHILIGNNSCIATSKTLCDMEPWES